MLGGFAGAVGLAGRLQLGKMAQAATGPDGSVDYDKLLDMAAQDPWTVQYINPLRQAQLTQRQLIGLVQTQNAQNANDINTVFASSANNPELLGPQLSALLARVPPANRPAAMQYIQAIGQGVATRNGKQIQLYNPDGTPNQQGFADWKANLLPLAAQANLNPTQMAVANMPPKIVGMGYTSPEAYKPVAGPVTPGGAPTVTQAYQYGPGGLFGGAPANTLAPSSAPSAPVRTDIAPGTKATIGAQAKEYATEGPKQYNNAVALQGRLATMQHDLDTMVSGNPSLFTNPGTAAEARMNLAKAYNTFMQSMGADASYQIDPTKVANMEELMKEAKLSGFSFMNSMMGAQREAAQIVQAAMRAVPNAENSPVGMQYLLNSWKELAQRQIDQRIFETNWLKDPKHDGSLLGADETFNTEYPAQAYAYRAVSNTRDPISGKYVQPYAVKSPKDLGGYLPGTVVKLPDGRMVTVTPKYSNYAPITLQQ